MNVTVRKMDDLCPVYKGFCRVKRLLMNGNEINLGGDADRVGPICLCLTMSI
jgi:hypothetical protein